MFKGNFHDDIDNCNHCCEEDNCNVNAYQEIDVCVPITIEPYVDLGEAVIECIEEPCIQPCVYNPCNKNGTCKFTIEQRLCVMVPIEFKAKAKSGPTSVICGDVSDEGCQTYDCDENSDCKHENNLPYKFYVKGKMVE